MYVGALAMNTTEKSLTDYFSQFGDVSNCQVGLIFFTWYMMHDTWWLMSRTPGRGIVDTSEGLVGCHLVVVHLFFRFSAGFPPVLVCFTGSFHCHFQTCLRSWLTLSLSSSYLLSLLWVSSWRTPAVFLLRGCLASYSTALLLAQWRSSFWHLSLQIALPVRLLRLPSLSWLRHFLLTLGPCKNLPLFSFTVGFWAMLYIKLGLELF